MTRPAKTPWDIDITVDKLDDDADHSVITVAGAVSDIADDGTWTDTQLLACAVHVAGYLARLALELEYLLLTEQIEHGCHTHIMRTPGGPVRDGGCHVATSGHIDLGDWTPSVWVYVPPKRVKHWTGEIRRLLAEIHQASTTVDTAQPTTPQEPVDQDAINDRGLALVRDTLARKREAS